MGVQGVQFDGLSSALDLTTLSASARRELRHVLSSQDEQLVGLRGDIGVRGFGIGADVDQAIARVGKLVEAAAGMSAPLVCIDLGPLPTAIDTSPPKPKVNADLAGLILLPERVDASDRPTPLEPPTPADTAFISQLNAAMDELGRRADRFSCMLAFRSELASIASLKQAVTGVNCPWFGIDLDPVAVARDRWDMDRVFSEIGQLIRHVRGRDATVGAERRTQPARIGRGNVQWPELLANLNDAGYRGWMTIDPLELTDRAAGAEVGVSLLRSLLH
jgi:hypothetical protein